MRKNNNETQLRQNREQDDKIGTESRQNSNKIGINLKTQSNQHLDKISAIQDKINIKLKQSGGKIRMILRRY